MTYWVKWECPTENIWFYETVSERELLDRINDPTIRIIEAGECDDEDF